MLLRNRVRDIRQERGLTQQSLAGHVGVTRQTIIAIEKGKFAPSVKLALELASALGASVETMFWLEKGEGESA
jgi:putative transcriptional regulator